MPSSDDVLTGLLQPQVVLRVGWPAPVPGSPATGHTPRRALADVIRGPGEASH